MLASTGSAIPDNFQQTAEAYNPSKSRGGLHGTMPAVPARNPQTVALLELLGLPYTLDPAGARAATGPGHVAAGACSISMPFIELACLHCQLAHLSMVTHPISGVITVAMQCGI